MKQRASSQYSYWSGVWKQFKQHRIGWAAFIVVVLFCLVGVYAPFLASSKPLVVNYEGSWYFPLFRYLFYKGFYSKPLDLFFNLLIFTLPLFMVLFLTLKHHRRQRMIALLSLLTIHLAIFCYVCFRTPNDPALNSAQSHFKQAQVQLQLSKERDNPLLAPISLPDWKTDLSYMNAYAKLNLLLSYQQKKAQYQRFIQYEDSYKAEMKKKGLADQIAIPILWNLDRKHAELDKLRYNQILSDNEREYPQAKAWIAFMEKQCHADFPASSQSVSFHSNDQFSPLMMCDFLKKLSQEDIHSIIQAKETVKKYEKAQAKLHYMDEKQEWLEKNSSELRYEVMPLLRSFHWEEDAGGNQELNRHISWWDLTRINRKDMVAALIFGVRISNRRSIRLLWRHVRYYYLSYD